MNTNFSSHWRRPFVWPALLLMGMTLAHQAAANPTGGSVTQGSATFSRSGSTFNINQTSASASINWQSFNIRAGQTVNFNQPSSTSVTWNQINGGDPSRILGTLNANGYVVLQNSAGFFVGGDASLNVHGLVMTTASAPALNLSSGGPWSFDAPPPTAKIVNYGRINIAGGGSAYLIANDIKNNGTISAPGGSIGLYAGQKVLLSMSPDGRGLSAEVTIPQGMVDNNGKLLADAGNIALQAQMVNQNGVIQANSAQDVNGTIELIGGDSVKLGARSVISAQGNSQDVSSGGSVTIQGGNTFSDQAGSAINVSGGTQGGNGGQVEISAPMIDTINSSINGGAQPGFTGGTFTLDPITTLIINASFVSSYSGMSQINITTSGNIQFASGFVWSLPGETTTTGNLDLSAGNNITFLNGSGIQAGQNWNVSLTAGTAYSGPPVSGSDGIYLDGTASIQTQNGDINLWAANEVQVGWSGSSVGAGVLNSGTGGITTKNGGNINVTAEFGDVNSGDSVYGFDYLTSAPYVKADPSLGGIATANGGNVNINAGGNVISFSATAFASNPSVTFGGDTDPGIGCFGTAAGNVTINAGGNVYGSFAVMDGQGTINAQNIGTSAQNVALSLATGGWNLNAENSIYLQEVRNPSGLFDEKPPTSKDFVFTYDQQASLTLDAANAVYITGYNLPRLTGYGVPLLLPPIVNITAGPGGVVLGSPTAYDQNGEQVSLSDNDITLFPSPDQSLDIATTGGGWLSGADASGDALLMSDSGETRWFISNSSIQPFDQNDHASTPVELNNASAVTINLTGSQLVNGEPIAAGMENIILQTDKATDISVAGDMIGCSFYGENLPGNEMTSITVGGQIYNAGSFTSVALAQGFLTLPAQDTPLASELSQLSLQGVSLSSWYLPLILDVNPQNLQSSFTGLTLNEMLADIQSAELFPNLNFSSLVYNPNTKTLTSIGPLASDLAAALESPTLTLVRFNADGYPVLQNVQVMNNGQLVTEAQAVTDTPNWVTTADASLISTLSTESQGSVALGTPAGAYIVGGSGEFDITAGSISLGNSYGILSEGDGVLPVGPNYSYLSPYATVAANIDVTAGYLETPASTIACMGPGGSVKVTANGEIPNSALNNNGIGVSMDLGAQELLPFESEIVGTKHLGLGIYTTGGGDVTVSALGTIDVDSSCIATFDGGDINVESSLGDVDAGSGGTVAVPIDYFTGNYAGSDLENVPANGILAGTLTGGGNTPPGAVLLPGNINVETPEGSIYASAGGVSQFAYDEILTASSGSATITLDAGSPGYIGNLNLGDSGVIGINVNAKATGDINGLILAEGNANIDAVGNIAGTIFSGGVTTIGSGGTVSGTIVAVGGLNTSGGGNLSATVVTTSVNGGAGTLATTASASSSSQSASNQTTAQAQQQLVNNSSNDDKKKKKKSLLRTIGRVTVILAASN